MSPGKEDSMQKGATANHGGKILEAWSHNEYANPNLPSSMFNRQTLKGQLLTSFLCNINPFNSSPDICIRFNVTNLQQWLVVSQCL